MAGQNPDLVVRVAANIAALQADMAQAVATLKAIEGAATETAGATSSLASSTDGLGSSWVARVAEGMLLRDAIREVLSVAQELVLGIPEEAKALRNLSLQTQTNIEDLQVITAATREYGVEGDQLGRALFQLSQRIAGGDANVATAYHLMGISLDEVKDKSPIDLLLATERGLGTLSGAIQDTAAKDLYGARLGASMIAFSHGADDAMEKARALNTVASVESVKAAAEYADAVDRMTHSLHAYVMEVEGGMAMGIVTLTDAVDKGASKWAILKAMVQDALTTVTVGSPIATNLATVLDHLNQVTDTNATSTTAAAGAHQTAAVALTAHEAAARFMAATELDSAKPLLDWQVEYLGHLKEIGLLTAQNAAGIGVSADQLKKYEAGLQAAKKAAEDLAKAEAEADAIAMTGYEKRIKGLHDLAESTLKAYSFDGQIGQLNALDAAEQALTRSVYDSLTSEKDRAKVIEESNLRHQELMTQEMAIQVKHAAVVNAAVIAELDATVRLNAAYGENADGTLKVTSALDRLQIALDALHRTKVEGISQSQQEQLLIADYTKGLYDEAVAEDAANAAAAKHAQTLRDLAANAVDPLMVKFAGLRGQIAATQAQAEAFNASMAMLAGGNVGQMGASSSSSSALAAHVANNASTAAWAIGVLNNTPIGTRAVGGPVSAGDSYMVGERGPELFTPDRGGAITPNGGVGDTYTFNLYGTPESLVQQVKASLERTAKAGRKF